MWQLLANVYQDKRGTLPLVLLLPVGVYFRIFNNRNTTEWQVFCGNSKP